LVHAWGDDPQRHGVKGGVWRDNRRQLTSGNLARLQGRKTAYNRILGEWHGDGGRVEYVGSDKEKACEGECVFHGCSVRFPQTKQMPVYWEILACVHTCWNASAKAEYLFWLIVTTESPYLRTIRGVLRATTQLSPTWARIKSDMLAIFSKRFFIFISAPSRG
jgi:hypothetical protein